MALLTLTDISKQYDIRQILKGINLSIDDGERCVIIGRNGAGKSTIMKLITREIEPDEGQVLSPNGLDIKMLSQEPEFDPSHNVREAIESSLVEIKAKQKEYEELSIAYGEDYKNEGLQQKLEVVTSYLDHHNAWDIEAKINRILQEFKLLEYEEKSVTLLSGGEKRRVALASLLLQKPDLLLLDEPTNHLDVYMVEFLEELILKERYSLVFISHDRYFIDRIATKSVEIDDGILRNFNGGYKEYLQQKEKLLQDLEKQHWHFMKFLKQEEAWLNKGVKARVKRNEGRKQRVLDMKKEVANNPAIINKIRLDLEREQKSFNNKEKTQNKRRVLFEMDDIFLQAGDKKLINNFTTRILQNDKIAIVGKNGTGKSTLIKTMLGRWDISSGSINRAENLSVGYFDQNKEMLSDHRTLLETFCPLGGDRVEVRGRDMHVFGYLKSFLFPKEDLNKKIGSLSGGEKSRVALALLFTKNYDVMILDEPTNDLDINTINILEDYLGSTNAAVIIVSHDRYFVDKLANKLYIIENKKVEESLLDYSEYLDIEKNIALLDSFSPNETLKEIQKVMPQKVEEQKKESKKLSFKEKQFYEKLQKQIPVFEEEIEKIKKCLEDSNCYQEHGLSKLSLKLEALENEYENSVEQFLEFEQRLD